MKQIRLLTLLALLMAATGAWGMQIYISYPSWPTGTNVNGDGNLVLEMEASDSFENMKAKIEDKSGLNPTYMHLFFNSVEMANNETLNAKGVTSNSVLTLVYTPYSVTMKDGVKDATSWQGKAGTGDYQELPLTGLEAGTAVSVKYNGRLKVKGVKAKPVWDGDLSKLTAESTAEFATATHGMTIKGTLAEGVNVKVSIAQGATVTLDGATINGVHNDSYTWAGINCLGDATIILSGTNTVKGFQQNYPGIHVPVDKTLTIQGSGSLTASSNGKGCGIGSGYEIACGNIVIAGGTITAYGGDFAAGIGSGGYGSCGTVTITNGVTSVTATKGNYAPYSIGKGGMSGSCGTVTIGGTKYWENNAAVSIDAGNYLNQATIVYQP